MPESLMSFNVLGPVDVRVDGSTLKIAAPRQRALLTQLLLNANHSVTASTLIDGIWGAATPQHPEAALHIVVCRLRRALGVVAPRLVRDRTGYRIDVAPHEFDLARAQSRFAAASRAMRSGEMALAATSFDAALECWSGEPLADVAEFPFHDVASRRLREFQLGVVEQRNEAYLRCGRHLDVLRDIELWVSLEPWRERLRGHQMMALYSAGRQIEALAAYEDLRQILLVDFGVDPNAGLQRLHCSILRHDPDLLASLADVQAIYVAPAPAVPLPTGGRPDVATLIEQLRELSPDGDVVIVDGGPNVGRSWLVIEVPGRVAADTGNASIDPDRSRRPCAPGRARRVPRGINERYSSVGPTG